MDCRALNTWNAKEWTDYCFALITKYHVSLRTQIHVFNPRHNYRNILGGGDIFALPFKFLWTWIIQYIFCTNFKYFSLFQISKYISIFLGTNCDVCRVAQKLSLLRNRDHPYQLTRPELLKGSNSGGKLHPITTFWPAAGGNTGAGVVVWIIWSAWPCIFFPQ